MGNDKEKTDREKDFRVLKAMKQTLTSIIKDTTTKPGLKHPLSDATQEDIRQCLRLVSAREQELLKESNKSADMKPRFIDEPEKSVVVPISQLVNKSTGKKTDK